MFDGMRSIPFWAGALVIALLGAACSNDDGGSANGPCGSNGACPAGYTCEPRTNICLPNSAPDARVSDAGPGSDGGTGDGGTTPTPDSGSGSNIDAGSGGGPDGGVTGQSPVTTVAPQFTSPVNHGDVSFTLTASIAGSTFECSVDAQAFAACVSPFAATLPDGPHTLTARATAPSGAHELNPPTVAFIIDSVAPVIAINSPPDGAIIGNSTLVYGSSEPVAAFRCSFDGGEAFACGSGASGSTPIALANGQHTATVTGSDLAGNPGNIASVSFTFDLTVLSVSIDARQTACASESIAFAASQPGATFTCNLDGTSAGCTSPFALPGNISGGAHTFTVTATLGAATATNALLFTIDRTAPTVDIIGILPDNTNDMFGNYDASGNVFFIVNKPGISARCDVDNLTADCNTMLGEGSFAYGPLDDGGNPHVATVVVTDACGPTASATFEFSVDSSPPAPCLTDVSTTGGPDLANGGACLAVAAKSGTTGSLTFGAERGSYTCTLHTDGVILKLPGTPPVTSIGPFNCTPGTPIAFTGLSDFGANGLTWTLSIDGLDLHGNRSVTALDWIVDATPPTVRLGAATPNAANGSLRVAYTVAPTLDLTEGVTFPVCTLDGRACSCDDTGMTCTQVSAGDHVVAVRPRDHWANSGATVTSATPVVMTYGPNAGRLILIGHDFDVENGNTTALLGAALTDVPWLKTGAFNRKPRVLWLAPAGATGSAAFTNVTDDWASVIDVAGSDALSDPDRIDAELPDHDILFVFDQESSTTSAAIGASWNTLATGGETRLTHFLDNGGTVIVLDGWVAGDSSQLSETWRVVAGGDDPALGVNSSVAVVSTFSPAIASYLPILDESLDPTGVSDLFVADSYAAPASSVAFVLNDDELSTGQPREVYQELVFCETCTPPGIVFEKVFPVYTIAVAPPQNGQFYLPNSAVPLSVTPSTPGPVSCTLECFDQNCPCAARAQICACTSSGPNAFTFPNMTGSYAMEFLQKDPAGRPGRTVNIFAVTSLNLETEIIGSGQPDEILCLRVNPAAPSPPVTFAVGPNNLDVTQLDAQTNAACVTDGYAASLTLRRCSPATGLFSATDQAGNTGFTVVSFNFGNCGT